MRNRVADCVTFLSSSRESRSSDMHLFLPRLDDLVANQARTQKSAMRGLLRESGGLGQSPQSQGVRNFFLAKLT